MTATVFDSNAMADAANRGYWARTLSPQQRVAFAWDISERLWRMLGRYPDEQGLPRSIARVSHR
jgi:hypothetical protein